MANTITTTTLPSKVSVVDTLLEPQTQLPGTSTKRKSSDSTDMNLPNAKRSKETKDLDLKIKTLGLLLHWHEVLLNKVGGIRRDEIDAVGDLTSILWTAHLTFKQEANTNINENSSFMVGESILKWSEIEPILRNTASLYGFNYGLSDPEKAKTETLGKILSLFNLFKPRCNEVRLAAAGQITFQETESRVGKEPAIFFGIYSRCASLLKGCTFTPSLQSQMKQHLGPIVIAINLCYETRKTHQEEWKKIFIDTFEFFPFVREMAELLAGSKRHYGDMLEELSKLSLLNTTKSKSEATFPFSLVLRVAESNPEYVTFFDKTVPNIALQPNQIAAPILTIDFSDHGAFKFWHAAAAFNYKMRRGQMTTSATMKELMFHGTWGTHLEDLSLLQWMTEHEFHTYSQIGYQLRGRAVGETEYFSLIKFKRVCKLTSDPEARFISILKDHTSSHDFGSNTQIETNKSELYTLIMRTLEAARFTIVKKLRALAGSAFIVGSSHSYIFSPTHESFGTIETEIPELQNSFFYN